MSISKPPRLTGNPKEDPQILNDYLFTLVTQMFTDNQILDRLNRIAALDPLSLTISNPPTQAEVQAVANKLDAVIAAAAITTQ